ncbi:hypothetical protein QTH91_19055 [Variovorax dokdonensis]|uniref:Uncharacterized protein n=1 Tax=Variovorax dokdonensis TaxID=344883 RepID=A0ABT7NF94_9BURK|nr:hypothetical protein [Variovorax dokdonensis]MDM0046596.1 hypothetical protein [Variovorax dokdonensis]
MSQLWPWVTVAGLGALHGLNPATGWALAAARGVQSQDDAQARRALLPIALGHVASVMLVALAVAMFPAFDDVARLALQLGALMLLVALVLAHLKRGNRRFGVAGPTAGSSALVLWSFFMATMHGAGLMLVPALVPLCLSNSPAREITASGSFVLALAAVGVHMLAMLAMTAAVASGACGAARWCRRRARRAA